MVILKSLWRALQEHTVAPEAMAHRLLRPMVEHFQDHMACRETQLEVGRYVHSVPERRPMVLVALPL